MRRATAQTLVAALLWGTSFPAIRYGLEQGGAGPYTFVFTRFAVATFALLVLAAALRRIDLRLFRSPVVWGLGALNAVGYAAQFVAQDRTTASKTSLLVDINVVAIAILSYFFLRERHGKEVIASLVLGVVGVALLSTNGDLSTARLSNAEFLGDLLALGAGLVWAVYFVAAKHLLDQRPTLDGVALALAVLAITTLLLFPLALVTEGAAAAGTPTAWGVTVYLGLLPTALALYLWQEAIRSASVTVTAVLLLLEIVVAVALSVAFLHERLTGWALVGGGCIGIAALVASREPSDRRKESDNVGPG